MPLFPKRRSKMPCDIANRLTTQPTRSRARAQDCISCHRVRAPVAADVSRQKGGAVLRAYINYPNAQVTIHGDITCSFVRQRNKAAQRTSGSTFALFPLN